jgi:hypothetical protein
MQAAAVLGHSRTGQAGAMVSDFGRFPVKGSLVSDARALFLAQIPKKLGQETRTVKLASSRGVVFGATLVKLAEIGPFNR